MKQEIVLGVFSKKTGEILPEEFVIRRSYSKFTFIKVFQKEMKQLLINQKALKETNLKLRGESLFILLFLLSIADYNNKIPGPNKVAKTLNMKPSAVSRAYQQLKANELVKLEDKSYRLSQYHFFKGNDKQLEKLCRESFPKPKALPSGNIGNLT